MALIEPHFSFYLTFVIYRAIIKKNTLFLEGTMENKDLICPICGEPTYLVYGKHPRKDGLCKEHSQQLFNKEIEQCADCSKWHKAKEQCECKKPMPQPQAQNEETRKIIVINEENKSRCITCGRKTDGLLFCSFCYRQYHNKELLFRITSCSSVELLDEDYEGRFTCKDGHIVKSKSEREIDNYLFQNGIPHAYEKALPYGKTEKEVLHPDFFLPNYLGKGKDVWLEHWGFDDNNRDYTKTKKFKLPIYEKLGITLICTYEKTDTGDIDAALDRKLNKDNIAENEINHK